MKITAQEEYGLRILIRIAVCKDSAGLSISPAQRNRRLK